VVTVPYTLEQARIDVATLRGQVDLLSEILTQSDGAITPNTPAAAAFSMYALAGFPQFLSGGDGNTYAAGQNLLQYTGANLTVNSTSQSIPAGMSCPVASGVPYACFGSVIATQGGTAAQQAIRLSGPAANFVSGNWLVSNYGDFGAAGIASQYGLIAATTTDLITTSAGGGIAAGNSFGWIWLAIMKFSAAGTFGVAARCVTSSTDTWTFNTNSWAVVMPLG